MVTHANGSIFTGSYDNDVACGEASFLYPGGHTEVKGTWLQGQLHGEVRFDASLPKGRFAVGDICLVATLLASSHQRSALVLHVTCSM